MGLAAARANSATKHMGCKEGRLRLEMKDNFTRANSRCRATSQKWIQFTCTLVVGATGLGSLRIVISGGRDSVRQTIGRNIAVSLAALH